MTSPFISSTDAAHYLLFVQPDGQPDLVRLHQFLARYRLTIRTVKRGRSVLIDKASLDAHLNRQSGGHINRRKRALQSSASRVEKSSRSLHGAGVSGELVSDVHALSVGHAEQSTPVKTLEHG